MNAIPPALEWFWAEFHKLEPSSRLGGIYANKKGYHNTRRQNQEKWPGNYSYSQFAVDRDGSADFAAAIDLTFPDAQAGRYGTIEKYSNRLLAAGKAGRNADPRTVYIREFFGQCDTDRSVEGWDYAKARTSTSDSSHLWHIHISVHRKYANDLEAMKAILSILKGETVAQWKAGGSKDPEPPVAPAPPKPTPKPAPKPTLPHYANGSRQLQLKSPAQKGTDVLALQKFIGARAGRADGVFGVTTKAAVIWYQRMRGLKPDGIVGPKTWAPIIKVIGR